MKKLFLILFFSISSISSPTWGETMSDLIDREGIYYTKFSDVPFTGEVEGLYQGKFKNGKKDGSWFKYRINGQLYFKGDYRNGKREGCWFFYYMHGQLLSKGDYKNGKEEASSWYLLDGTLLEGASGLCREDAKISD